MPHAPLRLAALITMSLCLSSSAFAASAFPAAGHTWTADNGDGTFTNPLFYDEFSDPDLIRVGDDYYLTGTTMHTMPGLPILHSRDLVNWRLLTYAFDRLDLSPAFRLEENKDVYGQGIWAPTFRFHNGAFYIFSNVNGQSTQLFRATDPAGPWTRTAMKRAFHDLSVLFDDDGKVYVIWGYKDLQLAELNADLSDIVPGTERTIIRDGSGMGEGVHFYKIDGRYYILSAWFEGRMRMPCARADSPLGPYEVHPEISADEDYGLAEGHRLRGRFPPFDVAPPNTRADGRMSLHQGGIVQTAQGDWWGWSMMDFNSVGRLTALSPVTWKDGWPFFGLSGNLKRSPRTWTKPATGHVQAPSAPYQRNDDFAGPALANVWQWNHVPDDTKWSLSERPGHLRLHALPAPDFWRAKNTLTQRAIGPVSIPTAELDASGLRPGDLAGLALLNAPYATLGVARVSAPDVAPAYALRLFDQRTGATTEVALPGPRVWLRAHCDFLAETATFAYSTDGRTFAPIGDVFTMIFQLRTFQGVRYSLFNYHVGDGPSGRADFAGFTVSEPHPRGLLRPIPLGQSIRLTVRGHDTALPLAGAETLRVIDLGQGRVALRASDGRHVSAASSESVVLREGAPTAAETWQWTETVYGDLILMSLATHRHLRVHPDTGALTADHPGPLPTRRDGSCFDWSVIRP